MAHLNKLVVLVLVAALLIVGGSAISSAQDARPYRMSSSRTVRPLIRSGQLSSVV